MQSLYFGPNPLTSALTVQRSTTLKQRDGSPGQARLIDPDTRDYAFDEDGRTIGMSGVRQRVYLALATVRGSSAVASLGQGYTSIQRIGDNTTAQIENEINLALADLIADGSITLLSISIRRDTTITSRLSIVVQWRDNLTQTNFTDRASP
jgi:hypothetical protein